MSERTPAQEGERDPAAVPAAYYYLVLSGGGWGVCELICAICSVFFDYVPGSSAAEAISHFLVVM